MFLSQELSVLLYSPNGTRSRRLSIAYQFKCINVIMKISYSCSSVTEKTAFACATQMVTSTVHWKHHQRTRRYLRPSIPFQSQELQGNGDLEINYAEWRRLCGTLSYDAPVDMLGCHNTLINRASPKYGTLLLVGHRMKCWR